jgi:hypothetical protein
VCDLQRNIRARLLGLHDHELGCEAVTLNKSRTLPAVSVFSEELLRIDGALGACDPTREQSQAHSLAEP